METKLFAVLDKEDIVVNAFVFEPQPFVNEETGETMTITPEDCLAEYPECTLQEYNEGITVNEASIGYTYNPTLKAFIPPQSDPTYILNTQTYLWEPDPELIYNIHQNEDEYKWNGFGWYRVN